MNEKILKLIETYKSREERLSQQLAELKLKATHHETELKLVQNARVFWRLVIKDLEEIIRKDP